MNQRCQFYLHFKSNAKCDNSHICKFQVSTCVLHYSLYFHNVCSYLVVLKFLKSNVRERDGKDFEDKV